MSRDKQTEIHELAKQMSEAISTKVEQRYIEDEAKLQAVLIENGWRKATDVALEVADDFQRRIRRIFLAMCNYNDYNTLNLLEIDGAIEALYDTFVAELKKKYTQGKEEIPPYVRMDAKALPAILNVKYTESEKDDG